MSTILNSQVRKTGSRERKIRAQTRPRKETGSRECENKQLDPGD